MNGFIRLIFLGAMIATLTSCSSQPTQSNEDDAFSEPSDQASNEAGSLEDKPEGKKSSSSSSDEAKTADNFSNFDEPSVDSKTAQEPQAAPTEVKNKESSIEEELQQAGGEPSKDSIEKTEVTATQPELDQSPTPAPSPTVEEAPVVQEIAEPAVTQEVPPVAVEQVPAAAPELSPAPSTETASPKASPANITDLKFKANENGGTIIVQGDRPLTFTTRTNPDLHQFIVEVDNAILPDRLKRSLNTRDIKGSVGAIDAYQNIGSNKARFVVQMREGVSEPAVQSEGNSLLIVAGGTPSETMSPNMQATAGSNLGENAGGLSEQAGVESQESKALAGQTLTDFLAGNTQFYGNKISMEYDEMPIQKALAEIVDQSGLNVIISEEIKGNISLKLRQVPWDQALVVIMRARKLGYSRQGNLLRIAPIADLKAEEEDANKLAASRKAVEALKVRMFPISYAKVDELEKKLKDFLGERGKVVGDVRTNALVVTDIEENLVRVAKLIASLDIQPQQVLIEGKIVEAQEEFTRSIGVNWASNGAQIKLGNSPKGPVNMTPRFAVNQGSTSKSPNFALGFDIGTLDIFGSITSALSLSEQENKVKVLASPRIFTLSNEKADINQTTEVPVKQVTVNGNSTQVSFQFKPLTLKLEVTPQVTSDGSVIMKVGVNRQFQGAVVDPAAGSFAVNSREANTKVLVKNGQTAVIGGIYQSDATDGEQGVPWLRDTPFLGWLFKTKDISKRKSELLIFLTPRILGQLESSATKDL